MRTPHAPITTTTPALGMEHRLAKQQKEMITKRIALDNRKVKQG